MALQRKNKIDMLVKLNFMSRGYGENVGKEKQEKIFKNNNIIIESHQKKMGNFDGC